MKIKLLIIILFLMSEFSVFGQVNIIQPPILTGLCPGGNEETLGNIIIRETTLKDIDSTGLTGGARRKEFYNITIGNGFEFVDAGTIVYVGSSVHNNNGSDIVIPQLNFDNKSIYFSYKLNPDPSKPKVDWDTDIAAFVWSGITVKAVAGTSTGTTANIIRTAKGGGLVDANQVGNNPSNAKVHATVQAGGFDVDLIVDKTSICGNEPIQLTAAPSTATTYAFAIKKIGGWNSLTSSGNTCSVSASTMVNVGSTDLDTTFRVQVTKDGCTMETTTIVTIKPTPTAVAQGYTATYYNDRAPVALGTAFPVTPPAGTVINGYTGSGVIGSTFYPATFTSPSTPTINYTLKSSPGGCVSASAKLAVITMLNAVAPPPAFLTTTNPMPFCESGGLQKVTVTMCNTCVISSITTYPSTAKASESVVNAYTRIVYIDPTKHYSYNTKITVNYTGGASASETADISVFPTQTPSLNGLPIFYYSYKSSSVPVIYSTNICRSNDSIKLYAYPKGSEIQLYKVKSSEYNQLGKHILIPMSSGLIANPNRDTELDSINFVSNEIFSKAMSSSTDTLLIIKVINSDLTTFCSGNIYYAVGFSSSYANDIKLNVLTPSPYCIGDTISFEVKSNNTQPFLAGWCGPTCKVYERYSWYYGDGKTFLSDTSRLIKYIYDKPGEYRLRFTAFRPIPAPQCPVDTITNIIVGVSPKSEFFVKDNFAPNPIILKNTSTYNTGGSTTTKDSISNWHWYMGDGVNISLNNKTGPIYNYNHAGNPQPYEVYPISLVTTTDVGCKDSVTKYIPYFPQFAPSVIPYEEDFNNQSIGWVEKGQYKYPGDSSSWKNEQPNGTVIKSALYGKAWTTSKIRTANDTAGYYKNENSWVESPVFDLNPLSRPMISMDTWALTENQLDGANLQYCLIDTTFGDETWKTIGVPDVGVNWYNSSIVISKSLPGSKFDAGWTGSTGNAWSPSSYYLDNVKTASAGSKIRFRLSFNSNADNAPGIYDGFAFDNFFVGERNRMVLIEELVNLTHTDPLVETIATDPQALNIKYFVGHAGADAVNAVNKADPSARALLYGVDEIPRAVVDGIMFEDEPFSSGWGKIDYTLRTLNVAPFNIDVNYTVNSGALDVSTNIIKNTIKVLKGPFIVQIAMVEKSLTIGGVTYNNVHRKFLSNAAGNRIDDADWINGEIHSFVKSWNPSVKPESDIRIIVFVQDENTKEVYQAGFTDVPYLTAKDLVVVSSPTVRASNNSSPFDFNVYPNPSQGNINVVLGELFDEKIKWSILNNYGNEILEGAIQENIHIQQVPTSDLPSGIYLIRLELDGELYSKRFVIAK